MKTRKTLFLRLGGLGMAFGVLARRALRAHLEGIAPKGKARISKRRY